MTNILYYTLWGLTKLMHIFPLRVHYLLADFLYVIMYRLVKYRKKVIFTNITNSFPEKNEKEVKAIAEKFYHHFCDMVIETLYFAHIPKEEMYRRLKTNDIEKVNKHIEEGRNVVLVLSHYANWEWMSASPIDIKAPYYHFYKPLRSKAWDKFLFRSRSRWGALLTDKKDVYRLLIGKQREGVITASGFVGDQCPKREEIQYWTSFLNQETPVLLGAEKISKKLDAPVFFVHMNKIKRGYYDVEVTELIEDPKSEPKYSITEKHVRFLEEKIRQRPELWLWSHKRWKYKKEA